MTDSNDNRHDPAPSEPLSFPKKPRRSVLEIVLLICAVASGVMLFMAAPNILRATHIIGYLKAGGLALAAMAVSYGINRLALDKLSPLAAKGSIGALALSLGMTLAVGAALLTTTYSGLVFKDVAELQLQEHRTALGNYIARVNAGVSEAGRVTPVMRLIESDLKQKAICEAATSCVSGRGNGGVGTVARVFQELASRAAAIGQQLVAGETIRQDTLARLNAAIADYHKVLGEEDKDIWERRSRLQAIDDKVRQAAAELRQAVPLPLLAAYADELRRGVAVPDRPDATASVNAILSRHGLSLSSVLSTIETIAAEPPAFPKRTGVGDTLTYLLHFLPVALIAAVVDLAFPISYWLATFWTLGWARFAEEVRRNTALAEERNRTDETAAPIRPMPRARRERHTHTADPIRSKPKPEATRRPGGHAVKPNSHDLHPNN